MIVILLVILLLWFLMGNEDKDKPIFLLSIGLVVAYTVAVMASALPLINIPISDHETIRACPQIAYPFSVNQYRDYDLNLFSYSLTIGGPQGTTLLQYELQEDQSHFIRFQSYSMGLSLGLILLTLTTLFVAALLWLDKSGILPVKKERMPPFLALIVPQAILSISIIPVYLGSLYALGALFVLMFTLIPVIRAVRVQNEHQE